MWLKKHNLMSIYIKPLFSDGYSHIESISMELPILDLKGSKVEAVSKL